MARGSVTRRGDAWRIAIELGPDPVTGKRRQLFETFHGLKRDAQKRLAELNALRDQQLLGASPRMTLRQFLERWLDDYARTKAPRTYLWYRHLMEDRVIPHIGSVQLDKLTPSHIVHLQTTLRDSSRLDGKAGKLSANTVRHVHRVLHAALQQAVKWELLPRNPADRVDAPSVPRKEMSTFTIEQAQAFLKASSAEGTKWEAFFTTFLTTGLRVGELVGLRWEDADLDARVLRVRRSIQWVNGVGMIVKEPKTASSRRAVALGPDVVALLRKHQAEQDGISSQMGSVWQDSELTFPNRRGAPLSERTIHNVFTRICKRAGVPRIRPYDLRHSCASLLLASGVHPKVVAERLGHSSVNLTLSTYSHVLPNLQQDAANTLDNLLRQPDS